MLNLSNMAQHNNSQITMDDAFGRELRDRKRSGTRFLFWFALVVYPLTTVLDVLFVPESVGFHFGARMALLAVCWGILRQFEHDSVGWSTHLLSGGIGVHLLYVGAHAGEIGWIVYAVVAGSWLILFQFGALWMGREGFVQIFVAALAWLMAAGQWPDASMNTFLLPGGLLYLIAMAVSAFMPDVRLSLESRLVAAALLVESEGKPKDSPATSVAPATVAHESHSLHPSEVSQTDPQADPHRDPQADPHREPQTDPHREPQTGDRRPESVADSAASESNLTQVLGTVLRHSDPQARHRAVSIELIRPDTDLMVPGTADDLRRALGDITGYLLDLTENTTLQIALEVESEHVTTHFVITDSGLAFIKPTDLFATLRRFGKVRQPAHTHSAVSVGIILPFVKKLGAEFTYCANDHLEAYFIVRFPLLREIPV